MAPGALKLPKVRWKSQKCDETPKVRWKVRWNPKSAVKGPKVRWFAGESPKSAVEVPKVRWNSEKIIFIGEVLEFSRWIWKILGKLWISDFHARAHGFSMRARVRNCGLWARTQDILCFHGVSDVYTGARMGFLVFTRARAWVFWCLHGRAQAFREVGKMWKTWKNPGKSLDFWKNQ